MQARLRVEPKTRRMIWISVLKANDLFSDDVKNTSTYVFCENHHDSKDCYRAQRMTWMERMDTLKKKVAVSSVLNKVTYRISASQTTSA